MLPRTNPSRAAAQDELWSRLNVKADEVKHGPAELEPLAEWVTGVPQYLLNYFLRDAQPIQIAAESVLCSAPAMPSGRPPI